MLNLTLNLSGLFMLHGTAIILIGIFISVSFSDLLAFLAILFIHHLLIMLILSNMLDFFVHTRDSSALSRINIPIFITLLRISSLPSIVFLIILLPNHRVLVPLISYVFLAFITDFLDGNISRRLHETTQIGAYLDSMSDYAVLISLSIAYIIFDLLPDWFFIVVMARLFFQWAAAGILMITRGGITPHHSSLLAKASIFLTMTVYAIALLQFVPPLRDFYPLISGIAEWIAAPVLVISLIEKIIAFVSDLRNDG